MLSTLLSSTVPPTADPTPTATPTVTPTATPTATPTPTPTETLAAVADTVSLNADQFAALATIAALVIGLLTLIAVGVYRR